MSIRVIGALFTSLQDHSDSRDAFGDVQIEPLTRIQNSFLPFVIKAVATALQAHPKLNASLDESGAKLIVKRYFNIGVAIDTPGGRVAGVIRDCAHKNVPKIAKEIARLSRKAREKGPDARGDE